MNTDLMLPIQEENKTRKDWNNEITLTAEVSVSKGQAQERTVFIWYLARTESELHENQQLQKKKMIAKKNMNWLCGRDLQEV